jgi:predicted permease
MFLFRILLRLYPASFRTEYGNEMCTVFAEKRSRANGVFEIFTLWTQAFLDVFRHAVPMHADVLRHDVRHSIRSLFRAPVISVTVVVISALGIGANTAVFTVVDRVLTRPLPYVDPDRIVRVWEAPPGYSRMEVSPPNYRDWLSMVSSFETMAAYVRTSANLVGEDDPERVQGTGVTGQLLPLLGVPPLLGRHVSNEDDEFGPTPTVVLSHRLWQRRFGGDPGVLNRSVVLNDEPHVIVGVMPPEFAFPDQRSEFWAPLQLDPDDYQDRNDNFMEVVARLKDNVSLEVARAEMLGVMRRLETLYPEANEQNRVNVNRLGDEVPNQARLLLIALMGASLCVVLVACTNLANLLLARATVRRHELAVRCSLGAGRARLARQLLTESFTLASIGGACGILLAHALLPLLARLVPPSIPVADATSIDLRVLAFAAATTILTGVGFGALPALKAGRDAVANGLRESSRGGGVRGGRVRSILVIVEVSASVVLLIASGLLIRALTEVRAIDPGFRPQGVLTARTWLPWPRYASTADRVDFYTRVLDDLRALPNVESAAYTSFLPIVMGGGIWPVEREGSPANRVRNESASLRFVTPDYFGTLGIRLLSGRDVRESDTDDVQYVAVVSQSFVDRYWPGQNPIGRSFGFAFNERTVVGVVEDVRVRGLERESEPQVYLPYRQIPSGGMYFYAPKDLAIRVAGDPLTLVSSLREVVRRADPTQPLNNVQLLEEIVADNTASRDVQLRVLGVFAALAFLLAAIGIYGLLSFAAAHRAREIGVRMALGARKQSIAVMFLRNGLLLGAVGVLAGTVFGYVAGSAMQALLFGIDPMDPLTFGAAIGVALVMTVGGSLPPAMRAARLDPVEVIREG